MCTHVFYLISEASVDAQFSQRTVTGSQHTDNVWTFTNHSLTLHTFNILVWRHSFSVSTLLIVLLAELPTPLFLSLSHHLLTRLEIHLIITGTRNRSAVYRKTAIALSTIGICSKGVYSLSGILHALLIAWLVSRTSILTVHWKVSLSSEHLLSKSTVHYKGKPQ